jgi:DNA-binding CsgD family transcriptional regulator
MATTSKIGSASRSESLARQIASQWSTASTASKSRDVETTVPRFLDNPLLADLVGAHGSVVVQVLDMRRFKSVYVSPNISDITGFSPAEINSQGVWKWLTNLTPRELAFQVKNAYMIGKVQRTLGPRAEFRSAMINSGMRTKAGGRLRILCQNFTIEWDSEGRSRYQLFLWRDATHLFKSEHVVVRHWWRAHDAEPIVWTYNPDKAKFFERDLFSERELEILELVEHGFESKEIADRLGISPMTVDNHRKNAIQRLQVRNTDSVIEICKWIKLL